MIFISYKNADKDRKAAELLANTFIAEGEAVFYDKWNIKPGESILGKVGEGLTSSNIFVLIWSCRTSESHFVKYELNTYLKRVINDNRLRIIPISIDHTDIPVAIDDYKGYRIDYRGSLKEMVDEILGYPEEIEKLKNLQRLYKKKNELCCGKNNPVQYVICPNCESEPLTISYANSNDGDCYVTIECDNEKCKWSVTEEI